MAIQNQGYRKDLNLEETTIDTQALNNLAGAGIADDLRIIQNNLRNISNLEYNTITNGFFDFGAASIFVYTNDDVISVASTVSIGSTTLEPTVDYYVCDSDGETKFKLSTTSSSSAVGVSTITISGTPSPLVFDFIRKDPVHKNELINFIKPEQQDDEDFNWPDNINSTFDSTQTAQEEAKYFITRKYRGDEDTTSDREIKFEGIVSSKDPANLNTGGSGLADPKSPGVFIGDTRAFSSNDQPWTESGSDLVTESDQVSIGELSFLGDIKIEGISPITQSGGTGPGGTKYVTDWDYKIPIKIDGETFYLLMTT